MSRTIPPAIPTAIASTTTPNASRRLRTPAIPPLSPKTNRADEVQDEDQTRAETWEHRVRSWHGRAAYEGKGLADDDVGERVGKAFVQGRSCRVGMPRVLQADEDLDTRAPGPSGPEPRLYRRTET